MSPDEAADFVEGYRRRSRNAWERARIGWWMQVADKQGREMRDVFPFEWDKRPKQKRVSKKQRDDLRLKAAAIAQKIQQANVKK